MHHVKFGHRRWSFWCVFEVRA